MNISELKNLLSNRKITAALNNIYGGGFNYGKRYAMLADQFISRFGNADKAGLFSSPGRIEIGGNHTDHQKGKVLAAAIDLDIACIAAPSGDMNVNIYSETGGKISLNLNNLNPVNSEKFSSAALIRGIASDISKSGFKIGGFNAVTNSSVPVGAGLSSSAAFEILIGNIFNAFYAGSKLTAVDIAQIGQNAENNYFGKPCGLMDQLASSLGGITMMNFAQNNVDTKNICFDFDNAGYDIAVVKSEASHENLTNEYASIPAEMFSVAHFFGKNFLAEVSEDLFFSEFYNLRREVGDRAVLRAVHFFEETERAEREYNLLAENKIELFMREVVNSGKSSYMYLQNIDVNNGFLKQPLSVELALCEKLISDKGAFRVHGGGFGGTILVFVKKEFTESFIESYKHCMKNNVCIKLKVRNSGGLVII